MVTKLNLIIMMLGTLGEKFYIILQGSASVWVPNSDLKNFKERFEDIEKHKLIVKLGS